MPKNLGNALKNNIGRRRIQQQIKNTDISSRNRNIKTFEAEEMIKADLFSKCEVNSIDDYLSNVKKNSEDFLAKISDDKVFLIDDLKATSENKARSGFDYKDFDEKCKELSEQIKIVRRPKWTDKMTAAEIAESESEAFIVWKKELAHKFQESKLTLTPFEKNLEVWKQLWRVIEKSDVIIQIVDARNPLLFWSRDLFKYVKEVDPSKKTMLLVNKSDLLHPKKRLIWKQYFDQNNVNCAFFSAKIDISDEIDGENSETNETSLMSPAQLISLFEELGKDSKKKNASRATIGLVGYPNVGKSSVINVILGEKKVSVGSTPGKTKHLQTLNLNDDIQLCDCPGLVFPTLLSSRAELICSGIISVDHSPNVLESVELICQRVSVAQFLKRYNGVNLPVNKQYISQEILLSTLATHRGWLIACKVPNTSTSARKVIKDYLSGDLLFCFPPPGLNEDEQKEFYTLTDNIEETKLEFPENEEVLEDLLEPFEYYDEKLGASMKKHLRKSRRAKRANWREVYGKKLDAKAVL